MLCRTNFFESYLIILRCLQHCRWWLQILLQLDRPVSATLRSVLLELAKQLPTPFGRHWMLPSRPFLTLPACCVYSYTFLPRLFAHSTLRLHNQTKSQAGAFWHLVYRYLVSCTYIVKACATVYYHMKPMFKFTTRHKLQLVLFPSPSLFFVTTPFLLDFSGMCPCSNHVSVYA